MHLDTHAVIWLYDSRDDMFPHAARRLLDAEPLAVSPTVELELQLLHEIGRVAPRPEEVLTELRRTVDLTVSPTPFAAVVARAVELVWTRDPFDRLICAHALTEGQILLTKDRKIRDNLPSARWDG